MSKVSLRPVQEHHPLFGNQLLVDRLAQEFRNPSPGTEQPLFSIERPGTRQHIVVVWDEWKNLSQQQRSAVILNAYEAWQGIGSATSVSVAMGLTSDEARRLGYVAEPAAG